MMDRDIIDGYHGTTKKSAEVICKEQRMFPSKRNNDWLGNGIYFFANAYDAQWWISHARYCNRKTSVLTAKITYVPANLLDLDIQDDLKKLNDVVHTFISLNEGQIKADMTPQQKWCFACNLIHEIDPNVELIARTFPHHEDSSIFPINRRQICVFDNKLISDIREFEGVLC